MNGNQNSNLYIANLSQMRRIISKNFVKHATQECALVYLKTIVLNLKIMTSLKYLQAKVKSNLLKTKVTFERFIMSFNDTLSLDLLQFLS